MLFKSCPKCGGDLTEESDKYGKYKLCIQCGYCREIEENKITFNYNKFQKENNVQN